MFKNILLASDGSDHSVRAAKKAAAVAGLVINAVVTIIYVIDSEKSKQDVLHHYDKSVIEETRRKRLESVENMFIEKKVAFKVVILHGEPGPTIVEYANSRSFDLVIVGSRGLNTLQEMVLGSVSHKLAKRVKAPVMIVK